MTAHGKYPNLRFSLTLATWGQNNSSAATAASLGSGAPDNFSSNGSTAEGEEVMAAIEQVTGFTGTSKFPSYIIVNLMTMDFTVAPSSSYCVVSGGACEMGQSALQAVYNLHDHWGVPFSQIEITPDIGQNDCSTEQFTLQDVDTVAQFALSQKLAGVHFWSYDRDTDGPVGSTTRVNNSMGMGYAGPHGYMKRFITDGL